jgi:hypothetical protein
VLTVTKRVITHIRESWGFKSIYILQEKSDTHDTYTLMISYMWQLFTLTQQSWTDPTALEKKGLPSQFTARRLTDPRVQLQFLFPNNHWSSRLKTIIYWWTCYISLLGSYLLYVIGTFNTCSWGSNHQSLTDTNEGYHLEDVGFPHHSPRPSQPTILYFPLMAQSGLKLTSSSIKPLAIKCIESK